MNLADWALPGGALLVALVLSGTLIERLPLSSAMVYLALGALLGPGVFDLLRPDPCCTRACWSGWPSARC